MSWPPANDLSGVLLPRIVVTAPSDEDDYSWPYPTNQDLGLGLGHSGSQSSVRDTISTSGSETEGPRTMSRQRNTEAGGYGEDSSRSSAKSSSKSSSRSPIQQSSSSSSSKREDWSGIIDREARRRAQNRQAQQKFRKRNREAKEAAELAFINRTNASFAYTTPSVHDLDNEVDVVQHTLSGLPWGCLGFRSLGGGSATKTTMTSMTYPTQNHSIDKGDFSERSGVPSHIYNAEQGRIQGQADMRVGGLEIHEDMRFDYEQGLGRLARVGESSATSGRPRGDSFTQ